MIRNPIATRARLPLALLMLGLAGTPAVAQHAAHAASKPSAAASLSASDLRTTLNRLLQEHLYLAAGATGAALGGRKAEFEAAAAALDRNSVAISEAIGLVYGKDAQTAFLPLWRKHIGMAVDYTTGVATKDKAKQDRAVAGLIGYTQELGAFLSAANPHLPQPAVAGLVKDHVLTLKTVIDAQAAGDPAKAYAAMQEAAAHMSMVADPLAAAIAKQFPRRFAGR